MTVNFEKTPYLEAIKEDWELHSESKIKEFAKKNIQLQYGKVTYKMFVEKERRDISDDLFSEKKQPDGWFARKVISLPAAIWCGLVKTIYHLALAIFTGTRLEKKSSLFHVLRDFQESFGWFATFFHDRYGQYLVQESQFQKSCYDCFATNTETKDTPASSSSKPSKPSKPEKPSKASKPTESYKTQESSYASTPAFDTTLSNPVFPGTTRQMFQEPIPSYKTQEPSYASTSAFHTNPTYPGISRKTPPVFQAPKSSRVQSDVNSEIRKINDIWDTKTKEQQFVELANSYLISGDLENGLKVIKEICIDHKSKEAFFVEIADIYLKNDELEKAIKTIKEICIDHKSKEASFVKIAEIYLKNGELEKAIKTIKEICIDNKSKEAFFVKIAEIYLKNGELEKAIKTIKEICIDNKSKEASFVKIAEIYLKNGELEKAIKTIKEMCIDNKSKEAFFVKIAEIYLNKGELENAINTIKEICIDNKSKEAFFVKIAQFYFDKDDQVSLLELIYDTAHDALSYRLIRDGHFKILFVTSMNDFVLQRNFFENLAKYCYDNVKHLFSTKQASIALENIKRIAIHDSIKIQFLNLKTPQNGWNEKPKLNDEKAAPTIASYYKIFGLEPSASIEEVTAAYRKLALKNHPDKVTQQSGEEDATFAKRKLAATEKFYQYQEAYDIISGKTKL